MVHHVKRGIIAGIVLWILIFIEVSLLMFVFGLERGEGNYYFVHFLLLSLFIIGVSAWYFLVEKKEGFYEGALLGVIMVIVTNILDSFITVPLFIKDYSFFSDWDILIGGVLMILIPAVVGLVVLFENKSLQNNKNGRSKKGVVLKKSIKKRPVKKRGVRGNAVLKQVKVNSRAKSKAKSKVRPKVKKVVKKRSSKRK